MADLQQALGRAIARAWSDADFKTRLLSDPAGVLTEEGAEIPAGVELVAVEDTETRWHLVVPAPPGEGELSEEDLANVAGGTGCVICHGP